MTPLAALALLFIGERAHQWQALGARDWTLRWNGRVVSRRAVIVVALAIGWGEGLGFYAQGERAFWAMIFWVYAAHVVLSGVLAARGAGRGRAAAVAGSVAAAGLMIGSAIAAGDAPSGHPSWIGDPGFRLGSSIVPGSAIVPIVAVLAGHAIPCFVRNVLRTPRGRRLLTAGAAVGAAALEWQLVARSLWYPEGAPFPDLPDWWNLGGATRFFVEPLWMAPFLAHVAVDAIRFGRPAGTRA